MPLAPAAAKELAAAVGAALDNVRRHVGEDARAWILVEDEPDAVIVTVRDDGPGIPEGRLAQAEGEGRLGVALSIRGRLREIGGTAELISVPGQGTEVELKVPKAASSRIRSGEGPRIRGFEGFTGEGGAGMSEQGKGADQGHGGGRPPHVARRRRARPRRVRLRRGRHRGRRRAGGAPCPGRRARRPRPRPEPARQARRPGLQGTGRRQPGAARPRPVGERRARRRPGGGQVRRDRLSAQVGVHGGADRRGAPHGRRRPGVHARASRAWSSASTAASPPTPGPPRAATSPGPRSSPTARPRCSAWSPRA